MATPTSRLLLSRLAAAISTPPCSSSSLLLRRPFSSSLPSSSDSKPPPPSIWNMLLNPKASACSSTPSAPSSDSSSKVQTNLNGSLFNPSSSSSSSSSSTPINQGSINVTAPGGSPYDQAASLWLDGPEAKAKADAQAALTKANSQGPYDSSSPFYNPKFNIAPFSTSPTPLPQLVQDKLALTAAASGSPPPPTNILPPSGFTPYVSPFPVNRSFNPSLQTLPRLMTNTTTDPVVRWKQLSQEFKLIHKRKVPDQFTGRTLEFSPGGIGRVITKFNGMIANSKMRIEERRKMRFERNPDKEWRLRRERHMRRFAVAMRRNVQIVNGLRLRNQSPVL